MITRELQAHCFTKNAITVLEKRYLLKDKEGQVIETPTDMFRRVAETIAHAEQKFDPDADTTLWAERFYEIMAGLEFLPNSPTLDECRPGIGSIVRLLCSARRGLDGGDL